ncbi:MAG: hypothetical protein HGA25_03205 [Clostridiales bacterium]|nr:hypothetical protein [Clostridiales bacterium]
MSENKCGCEWCKKNIGEEAATQHRVTFIVKVFELMFAQLFNLQQEATDKAVSEFKVIIEDFFTKGDKYVNDLIAPVIDISFNIVGLNTDLKPSDICANCDKIHGGIENACKALQLDNRIPETPILNNVLTPEIMVNYELGKAELPKEIVEIYNNIPSHSLSDIMAELRSSMAEAMEDSGNRPTVH